MDQVQEALFELPECSSELAVGRLKAHVRNGAKFRDPLEFDLHPEVPGSSVPHNHLVRQIAWVIARLDLGWLRQMYAHRGGVAYQPEQMLGSVLYGMTCGVRTGKQLQESCLYDERFKFLMGAHKPDDRTFERFIERVGPDLQELLAEVLYLARRHSMARANEVAIDGCKVAGSSSYWNYAEKSDRPPSDSDAKLMKSHGRSMVGYNALAAVDTEDGLIVGAELITDQNDWKAAPIIVEAVRNQLGEYPAVAIADSGFESPDGICGVEDLGVDTVFAPREMGPGQCLELNEDGYVVCPVGKVLLKRPHSRALADGRIYDTYRPEGGCRGCPLKATCAFFKKKLEVPQGADPAARYRNRARARSAAYQGAMKRRQRVETPFAFLKRHDRFERLRGRNLRRARAEYFLWVVSYNLRKILRKLSEGAKASLGSFAVLLKCWTRQVAQTWRVSTPIAVNSYLLR